MAAPDWTSAELSADEIADFASDYPIIASNVIPETPDNSRWTTAGQDTSTDRTDSDCPAKRVYDGYVGYASAGDSTSSTDWYFNFDFGSAGIEFDAVAIIGHNFDTKSIADITIELDNGNPNPGDTPDGTFANISTIATISPRGDDLRLIEWELYHTGSVARRYSDVQYVRLHLSDTSSFTAPQMTEIFFLSRCQFPVRPVTPFDKDHLKNEVVNSRTMGGVKSKVIFSEQQFVLNARFVLHEDTPISDFQNVFKTGSGLMVWCWEPTSSPNNWHAVMRQDELSMPSSGWTEREATIDVEEQGPENYYLARGIK